MTIRQLKLKQHLEEVKIEYNTCCCRIRWLEWKLTLPDVASSIQVAHSFRLRIRDLKKARNELKDKITRLAQEIHVQPIEIAS